MKPNASIAALARAGYAARGIIYLVIGLFAILAGIGSAAPKGSEGALQVLLQQPAGDVMVWLMIGGLVGYAMWRLIQAVGDTDDHGRSPKGLAVRAGLLASAATYSLLALFAFDLVTTGSGQESADSGVVGVYRQAFGYRAVVWLVAATLVGVGAAHVYKGYRGTFRRHFQADEETMTVVVPISKVGLVARGIVFVLLGVMLATARGTDGGELPSTADALDYLQGLPLGFLLLIACGAGLLAFATYSLIEAVYRRVRPERALN